MNQGNTLYRSVLSLALILTTLVLGCAEGVLTDVEKKRTAADRSWQPLEMTKADMNNAGATLGVKAIELQPGETPEQAVFRVFGVQPTYDVRKLLDTQEVAQTDLFETASQHPAQDVCNDSCAFSNDGICDEPSYCSTGTDCSDCGTPQPSGTPANTSTQTPTCPYTNDGYCDEPTYCPVGTDTADCSQPNAENTPTESGTPVPDSCAFANDGFCDEPAYCAAGTDTTDCNRSAAHAGEDTPQATETCAYTNDGICDEPTYCPVGTDTADCSQPTQNAGPNNTASAVEDNTTASGECVYANDGVCDEPTYCAIGTDANDCNAAQTASNSGASANGSNGNTACPYTNDGVCDEPTYCPFGTDTNDCNAAQPAWNSGSGSSGSGGSNSCAYANDGVCDEPTYCTFGTDTNDCSSGASSSSSSSTSSASTPSAVSGGDNSCSWAHDGVCDEGGVCRTGTDSADCSGFSTKFAGAMGGESLEMVIIGYTVTGVIMAWRIGSDLVSSTGQLLGSFMDGLQAVDSNGRPISVQLRTDAATIEAARNGRLNGASANPSSGNVGVATVNYINERAAESARADGRTCEPSVHAALQSAVTDTCKGPKRKCVQKMPNEDRATYCAETQRRIDRGRRCIDARNEVSRVCYGGLGHPDSNGVRGENDSAVQQAENALNTCIQKLQQYCQ